MAGPDRVLSEAQVQKLIVKLQQGPAAVGCVEDQHWTVSRVRMLIGRMFHKTVAVSTVWRLSPYCVGAPPAEDKDLRLVGARTYLVA